MPINDELLTLMTIKMEKRRFRSRSRSSGRSRYPEAKSKRRDVSMESSSHSNSSMEVDHKQVKQTLQSCPVEHPDIIEERKSETSHEKESSEELIIFSDEAEQEEGENEGESKGSNSQNSSNQSDDTPSDHNSKPDQRAIARKLRQYYEDGLTAAEVLEKNIRGVNKATVYRHYTTLKNEGTNIKRKALAGPLNW